MGTATGAWPIQEADPQRIAILDAADRLLTGTPQRSTGNLSIVQLAIEADLKYWIIAQKHTDLRDHFQRLAAVARRQPGTGSAYEELQTKYRELRLHCAGLETLLQTYATVINELSRENQILREQRVQTNVTPLKPRTHHRVGDETRALT
jgi:hypothetical protein